MTNPYFNNFFPPNVITFISESPIDFSLNQTNGSFSVEQLRYLSANAVQLDQNYLNIKQVHADNVIVLENESDLTNKRPVADAVITSLTNFGILVRTADCLPIFICDVRSQVIGIVHAGWKSTLKQIAGQTIGLMKSRFHCDPSNIKIAFGPCLRKKSFEVSPAFVEYFKDSVEQRDDTYYFDLAFENKKQLMKQGVCEENVFDCNIDTFTSPQCFSYRREGEAAGRMLSLIMQKSGEKL